MFISETQRERASTSRGGAERERERPESEAGSRLWAVSTDHDVGLKLMNCEIMTWAEVRCLTDWATQVPRILYFLNTPLPLIFTFVIFSAWSSLVFVWLDSVTIQVSSEMYLPKVSLWPPYPKQFLSHNPHPVTTHPYPTLPRLLSDAPMRT